METSLGTFGRVRVRRRAWEAERGEIARRLAHEHGADRASASSHHSGRLVGSTNSKEFDRSREMPPFALLRGASGRCAPRWRAARPAGRARAPGTPLCPEPAPGPGRPGPNVREVVHQEAAEHYLAPVRRTREDDLRLPSLRLRCLPPPLTARLRLASAAASCERGCDRDTIEGLVRSEGLDIEDCIAATFATMSKGPSMPPSACTPTSGKRSSERWEDSRFCDTCIRARLRARRHLSRASRAVSGNLRASAARHRSRDSARCEGDSAHDRARCPRSQRGSRGKQARQAGRHARDITHVARGPSPAASSATGTEVGTKGSSDRTLRGHGGRDL
jgi:hypothetical protein